MMKESKKMNFSKEQNEILNLPFDQNIIVNACAGSGKTTILIERVKRHFYNIKKEYKKIVILVFNNAIKEEISLQIKEKNLFQVEVSTFHNFFIHHILPFSNKIKLNMLKNFDLKYRYECKTENFEEWKATFEENKIVTSSKDPKKDFLLEYILKILENNKSCQEYIKSKFECMYIDEAQDNNEIQYKFIEIFLTLGINIFMVGDPSQSLYSFRGANSKVFLDYENREDFISKKLNQNFRSHSFINEFANNYSFNFLREQDTINFIEDVSEAEKEVTKLTVLRSKGEDCKKYEQKGYSYIKTPSMPPEIDNVQLVTLLLEEYFTTKNVIKFFKKITNMEDSFFKYKNKLTNFFKNPTNENLKILNTNVFSKINWLLSETEIDYIVEKIKNENFKDYYNLYEKEKIVMTIHISKGLQFDNILIHKKDFYNRRGELEKEKFYVASTRAKKKLFIIRDN